MDNLNITFIGCGNMGRSLIGGLIANRFPSNNITCTDINAAQRQQASDRFGIEVLDDNILAGKDANVIVLAVKPQSVKETLIPLRQVLASEKPLLLSIAAGIMLDDLACWGGEKLAIVRVMPNTPSLVNAGAAGLCANKNVSKMQRDIAETIMRSVGITIWLEDESLMDVVTALSGSGPAYFFYFMEIMQKTGETLGLTREQSMILTLQTALGAARMALESDHDPETLRKQVTSPGGTTEKAISFMQDAEIEDRFRGALIAAYDRARELAEILGDKH